MAAQVLDSMDLERERGITIKAQSVTLDYHAKDGNTYLLNFIDTPGHVDFSYEVSRSLAACEGALLVVDAGQGVEAQTLANCYTALEMNLDVVPVLNKIDLPQAEPDRVAAEIEDIVGIDAMDAVRCSAKTGIGVDLVLEERRIELSFEYKRWYDIKRRKLGDVVFKGANSLEPHENFDAAKDYLMPLPRIELDVNPNLAPQNPGY